MMKFVAKKLWNSSPIEASPILSVHKNLEFFQPSPRIEILQTTSIRFSYKLIVKKTVEASRDSIAQFNVKEIDSNPDMTKPPSSDFKGHSFGGRRRIQIFHYEIIKS